MFILALPQLVLYAVALLYIKIWLDAGKAGLTAAMMLYLLRSGHLLPLVSKCLFAAFPPIFLANIAISIAKKRKATQLYYACLIFVSEFAFLVCALNFTAKIINGENLAAGESNTISADYSENNAKSNNFSEEDKTTPVREKQKISPDPIKKTVNSSENDAKDVKNTEKNTKKEEKSASKEENQQKTAESTRKKEQKSKELPKDSTFFGKNYVAAYPGIAVPPQKKKNILFIMMESMEQTFSNGKLCGSNLIPFLKETANMNISFSDYTDGYATNWTQASLVAAMTGIPSSYLYGKAGDDKDVNAAGEKIKDWLNGVYSLGEILRDNGYERIFVQGGSLAFSGTRDFLYGHGFNGMAYGLEELRGYGREEGPWGISDKDLYAIFEDKLSRLPTDKPFFAVLSTIDTHHYNEPEYAPKVFDMRSKDTIYYADSLMKDFLNWFYLQPYSENTMLVIAGDHLRMSGGPKSGSSFLKTIPKSQRRIYNVFINSVYDKNSIKTDRTFTQADMFPTILEAAGFSIEGHRLGLGVSVFSSEKTLVEKYGHAAVRQNLRKSSPLYGVLWE